MYGRGVFLVISSALEMMVLWSGLLQVFFFPRLSYGNAVSPSLSTGILYYLCKRWRRSPATSARQSESGFGRDLSSSVTPWEYSYRISRVTSSLAAVQPLHRREKLVSKARSLQSQLSCSKKNMEIRTLAIWCASYLSFFPVYTSACYNPGILCHFLWIFLWGRWKIWLCVNAGFNSRLNSWWLFLQEIKIFTSE